MIAEAENFFWKYQKLSNHNYDECVMSNDHIASLPDEYVNERDLYQESFKLRCLMDHSIYGMIYLLLARRNNATLLTMDRRLVASAEKEGVSTA